jgi:hypothetical protein
LNDTGAHVADPEALARDDVRRQAVGHHKAVLLLVHLEKLHGDGLADEIFAVRHAHRDVRLGDEPAQVLHLDEQPAAVHAEHHRVHRFVRRLVVRGSGPRQPRAVLFVDVVEGAEEGSAIER